MRSMMQFIVTTVYNDANSPEKFKKIVERFEEKIKKISIGDISDDESLAICVKTDDGVAKIK